MHRVNEIPEERNQTHNKQKRRHRDLFFDNR